MCVHFYLTRIQETLSRCPYCHHIARTTERDFPRLHRTQALYMAAGVKYGLCRRLRAHRAISRVWGSTKHVGGVCGSANQICPHVCLSPGSKFEPQLLVS